MSARDSLREAFSPRTPLPPGTQPYEPSEDLSKVLGRIEEHFGKLHLVLAQLAPPEILVQELVQLDGQGTKQWECPRQFASVAISNFTGAPLIVAEGPRQSSPPGYGAGVGYVPAGEWSVLGLKGNVLAVYGAAGGVIAIEAFSKPQGPAGSGEMPLGAGTSAPSAPLLTNASTPIVGANPARKGLTVFNEGAAVAYVAYGAAASLTAYTVQIPVGGYWEMTALVFAGAISGITSAGTAQLRVTELS